MKLPEPVPYHEFQDGYHGYTESQMRQMWNDALDAAAKMCTDLARGINVNGQNGRYKECAEEILKLKEQT